MSGSQVKSRCTDRALPPGKPGVSLAINDHVRQNCRRCHAKACRCLQWLAFVFLFP
jgi:hypothetical protein